MGGLHKCCVPGCQDKNNPRQRFPHPNRDRGSRFPQWLRVIQNPQLHEMDPMIVYKRQFICRKHFSDNHFYGNNRNFKLSPTAVPDLFLPAAPDLSPSSNIGTEEHEPLIYCTNEGIYNIAQISLNCTDTTPEDLCISDIFDPIYSKCQVLPSFSEYADENEFEVPRLPASSIVDAVPPEKPSRFNTAMERTQIVYNSSEGGSSYMPQISQNNAELSPEDCEVVVEDDKREESILLENVKDLCRVCGNTEHSLTSIFGDTCMTRYLSLPLPEVMEMHLPLQLHADDRYPSNICSKCLNALSEWHELYATCAAVDQAFKNTFCRNKVQEMTIPAPKLQDEEFQSSVLLSVLEDHDYALEKNEIKHVNRGVSSERNERCVELVPSDISSRVIFHKKRSQEKDISKSNINKHLEMSERQQLGIPSDDCRDESVQQNNIPIIFDGKEEESLLVESSKTADEDLETYSEIEGKFLCKICYQSFKEKDQLNLHHKDCQQSPTICEICGKKVLQKYLVRHKNRKHSVQIICEKCGKLVNKAQWYTHMKSAHSGAKCCEVCCSVFPSSFSYSAHMKNHASGKLQTTFSFNSVSLEGKSVYVCPVCDKSFDDKVSIIEHLNEPIFIKCPTCHVTIKNKKGFILHKCKHWNCQFCMKHFYNRMSWKEHERIHTGEKPHKCKECHISFRTMNQKTNHVRNHRAPAHICKYCSRRFSLRGELMEHMRRIHEGVRFTCEICEKKLTTRTTMKKHFQRHLKERVLFTCDMCDKTFVRESAMKKHFQKHVLKVQL